ncbi:MAG: STAS domain-containing protein [Candidatus Riflebacteria bacterium]|nr:STAS domain-containing protein [Candidatus Riflebacteria bacterium]
MEIEQTLIDNIRVFKLEGNIDYQGALELFNLVTPFLTTKDASLLLDFSGVSLINSMGYVMILRLLKTSRKCGSRLKFCNLQGLAKESLEIMRFDEFKQATSTQDQVIESMKTLEPQKPTT